MWFDDVDDEALSVTPKTISLFDSISLDDYDPNDEDIWWQIPVQSHNPISDSTE